MLIKLWRKYEELILNYTDMNRQWYSHIGLVLCMIPFMIFNYIVYHHILEFDDKYLHIFLILLAFGKARILLSLIMLNNRCYFGKGHNYYSIGVSIFSIGLGVGAGVFLIIKDINGGFQKQENIIVQQESKINTNILNGNKYDYLIQDNK